MLSKGLEPSAFPIQGGQAVKCAKSHGWFRNCSFRVRGVLRDVQLGAPLQNPSMRKAPGVHNFSLRLSILTFLSAVGGFLFGYDTGVISSAAIFLRKQYSLTNFQVEVRIVHNWYCISYLENCARIKI
uniref:Major facilitator superfamily (MFS) profile domain-containing protein n=1 Tax=Romanomermis culicivorax TaxID=13658 RepID=A0A915LD51_ROMCU